MFRYCALFFLLLGLVLCTALGNSLVKSRSKRAYHQRRSALLSIVDLLTMIVDEKHDLDKPKESVSILQRDSCGDIKSIGKPITHNARQKIYGAWMKDPLGIMGTETIFVMENYLDRNVLEEFENMDMLKAGITRKTYNLPYNWDGTGGVVYGPHLYYNRAYTNIIIKYNLQTQGTEAQIDLGGFTRKNSYESGGYSGVDLAVDEQGLWVLYGTDSYSYQLQVKKIDVYKNSLTYHWILGTGAMANIGNAFVACGVVYCIDTYNSRSTTINFAYDTKTGRQWNPNIQFTNQYAANTMVDYNPRERVLYAWDTRRLVTYPITFEKP